jgi:two-component system, sensor histidine kinase and response regulator
MTLPRLTFQNKLTILVLTATALGLAMASLGLALYERHSFRSDRSNELSLLANALGANAAASMVFNDAATAGDILNAVRVDHGIIAARLYNTRGKIFAEYTRIDLTRTLAIPPLASEGVVFRADDIVLTQAVNFRGESQGFIVLISDLHSLDEKYLQYTRIASIVLLLALLASYFFSSRLLRYAIAPILHLSGLAQRVSSEADYSVRSPLRGTDEIGTLIQSFNDMLDAIQQRDNALQAANDQLEAHVNERTSDLQKEVAERRQVESELRWKTAFLEAQVNSTLDGMFVVGPGQQILLLNQRLIDMLKLPQRLIEENRYSAVRDYVLSQVADPESFRARLEYLYANPDECGRDEIEFAGGMVVDRHSSPVRGKDGYYYGKLWTFRDITQRKRAEEALLRAKEALASERQILRALIDNVPDFMYVKDADCRFLLANESVSQQMGAKNPEELIGKTDFDFYAPDLAKTFFEDEQRVIRSGQAEVNREEVGLDSHGHASQILTTQVPLRDTNGCVIGLIGIGRDITSIKKTEEALRTAKEALSKERQILRALIDNVPDSMYVKDADCRFLVANLSVSQQMGAKTPDDLIGKTDFDFYPPEIAKPFFEDEQRVIRSGQAEVNREEVAMDSQGKVGQALTTQVPLHDEDGRVIGLVGVSRDITARKKAEEEWQRAKEAAEAASRAKSEFLANMSHEIRTPLNGIIGMTDLALDTQITPEQREYLDTVKFSAESLLTVINDILDFSKVEAGKLELEWRDFNLPECVEGTLKTLALRADEKGLELLCDISPDVPQFACGDSIRLRQIVINLVGNALKFTHEGQVQLQVSCESTSEDGHRVHFVVSDTGIGIPLDKQSAIFQPFSQADNSTTRKYGGTGLGLSISASLVALMGGRMWVESETGAGSRFHFTTHLKNASTNACVTTTVSPTVLRGVRVLVVDDNDTNLRILRDMLSRWQMQPVLAHNGEEALSAIELAHQQSSSFPLILTDLHMPTMDGFTLIEHIRRRSLDPSAIVMLTSSRHRDTAERCQALGVSAYLLKPIRQLELRDALARVLGAQNSSAPQVARTSPPTIPLADIHLSILVAEDNAVNQRLIFRLLEKRGHSVKLAANGREAVQFLEEQPFDLVFMDIQMPEMDGLTATAKIRERERTSRSGSHTPIIALTAHAMKGDEERFLASGMDGYLSKPLHPAALDEILTAQIAARSHSSSEQPLDAHPIPH